MDLLKRTLEVPSAKQTSSEMGIVQYILQMRDWLEKYHEAAVENLQKAQLEQKR